MEEYRVFDKINGMLEGTSFPMEIKDISDLEDFLNDESNMQYDQYDAIARLYDELIGDPVEEEDIDY